MSLSRRTVLQAGLATLGAGLTVPAQAQAGFPKGPIRVVIPTAPGGGHDTMMRVIGQRLTEAWGQPVIVESRAGASGAIAASVVAKAPPDGLTLMVGYSALLTNVALLPNPGYRLADFVPVTMLAVTPIALGVRQSLGVSTLQEYVALARAKSGRLTYGSYGPASGGHFVGELLNAAAGLDVSHVAYKGEAPALQDLLGEQIDAACTSVGGVARHPGRIRPLAVSSATRFPLYPEVPTFAEAGYPEVNMPGWGGLFAPAGTPAPIVERLGSEIARILRLPEVSGKLLELGFEPVGWPAERLQDFLKEQLALIQKLQASGRIRLS